MVRNPMARQLFTGKYRCKTVESKKRKLLRKAKHKDRNIP